MVQFRSYSDGVHHSISHILVMTVPQYVYLTYSHKAQFMLVVVVVVVVDSSSVIAYEWLRVWLCGELEAGFWQFG